MKKSSFSPKRRATCMRYIYIYIYIIGINYNNHTHLYMQIVANEVTEIDVDRMDYLLRDSFNLGLPGEFEWRSFNC